MRRTEQVQGLRLMKFEEVYGRTHRGGLSQAEAAEVWVSRSAPSGAGATATRRREPTVSTTAAWAASRRGARWTRWRGCWSCSDPLLGLHGALPRELVADPASSAATTARLSASPWAQARGAQAWGNRRKRPRRALPGMMLPDGSSHEWVPGRWWDHRHERVWTMRPATYLLGSSSPKRAPCRFQGVSEAIRAKGLFCSLYADRASHYWNTPEAGGKVDKDTPTQVGRALAQLGIG